MMIIFREIKLSLIHSLRLLNSYCGLYRHTSSYVYKFGNKSCNRKQEYYKKNTKETILETLHLHISKSKKEHVVHVYHFKI